MAVENLTSLISALRSETATASITPERLESLLQKMVDAFVTVSGGGINIVCETKDDVLYVKGASALAQAGYVPIIFRYTQKANHLTDYVNGGRLHGQKKRGWHMMFNPSLISD